MNKSRIDFGDRSDESEHEPASETEQFSSCPECGGQVIHDEEHGETACKDCGLVVDEEAIDHGPEWRTFYAEENNEKSRVGGPITPLLHDKGLSTTIDWQDTDAYGNTLSSHQRQKMSRLRTWDERFRTKDAHERNLRHALGEISRMASALGVAEPVRETAGVLYRRAVEEDLLPGRSIEAMATASLYAAARQHGTPRTLVEFTTVSRVDKLRIQRAYRYLSQQLDLRIAPADPLQYVRQFASELDVSDEAERLARELLDVAEAHDVYSGKSRAGLAAAALYAATHLTNEGLTQATVSDVAHVSHVTIRDRYQELLDVYERQDSY
jgi:transcription initiation factor TFIIB